MELNIEVKWTQEDIENMLRDRLAKEGLLLLPQPKQVRKKKDEAPAKTSSAEDRYFVWLRSGKIKVKARAVMSPRAQKAATSARPEPRLVASDDSPGTGIDPGMLPEGTDIDALEAAAQERPLMDGESRDRPED